MLQATEENEKAARERRDIQTGEKRGADRASGERKDYEQAGIVIIRRERGAGKRGVRFQACGHASSRNVLVQGRAHGSLLHIRMKVAVSNEESSDCRNGNGVDQCKRTH